MSLLVANEGRVADEALATLLTFVRGFQSMYFLVLKKFTMAEGFSTFGTAIGFLRGMNGQVVPKQVGRSAEALNASGTLVGPVACVNPLVLSEVSAPRKGLPALAAFERLLPAVTLPMDFEC